MHKAHRSHSHQHDEGAPPWRPVLPSESAVDPTRERVTKDRRMFHWIAIVIGIVLLIEAITILGLRS